MFLKKLINPKPTIIIFFILSVILFILTPVLNNEFNSLFRHEWMSSYLVFIITLLISSFHALGINNLVYEKGIIKKNNLVIAFVYLCLIIPLNISIEIYFASFFSLFFLNFLFESYQKEYPLKQFFNAGIILSVISFISPNIILLAPLVIITVINYELFSIKTLLSFFIGFLIPFSFYFMFGYIFEKTLEIPEYLQFKIVTIPDYKNFGGETYFIITTVCLVSILSFYELFKWLYKKSIKSRKSFIIILFYFLSTILMLFLGEKNSMYYVISPLSIIIGNYFTYTKNKKIANILFFLLVAASINYKLIVAI